MPEIFFISDTHFGHKSIVRGTSTWKSGYRDFDTVDEMDNLIVSRINEQVGANDILYHLGDFSFGDIRKYRDALNVKNLHLVLGNHDKRIKKNERNIQSVFSSVQPYLEISPYNNNKIVLCHFAFRVWASSHYGSWHLYGHSHGRLPSSGRSMDVGVDTNDFYPYHYSEIEKIMSSIEIQRIDRDIE